MYLFFMIVLIVFAVLGMIVSPILAVRLVKEKGHDPTLWGVFAFFTGALGVIAAACLRDKKEPQEVVVVSEETLSRRKEEEKKQVEFDPAMQKTTCPVCGKEFDVDRSEQEIECPYCGKKLKRKL